jgi:CBS domain-containing protein
MIAKELMSTNLVVVPPEMPVAAVAELLAARGISAVPVVDAAGAPVGIVTEGDLIRRLAAALVSRPLRRVEADDRALRQGAWQDRP